MKRKYLPLILMLLAGAVTAIITYVKRYTMIQRLSALLVVLLVFYALGSVFVWLLDTFEKQNEKVALDDGEVIEKEMEAAEDTEDTEEEASETEDIQEE